eukprot:TRINITY_DN66273_c2_g1_i1.p2 TRINITY_DN66273_c2_g1~~TRINITY_DN66273_c2_g1_i1.p2  ORF type:complete len:359 (-),score=55.07 TRINITY_DN66273_c2_g1_i1:1302-2378(-)
MVFDYQQWLCTELGTSDGNLVDLLKKNWITPKTITYMSEQELTAMDIPVPVVRKLLATPHNNKNTDNQLLPSPPPPPETCHASTICNENDGDHAPINNDTTIAETQQVQGEEEDEHPQEVLKGLLGTTTTSDQRNNTEEEMEKQKSDREVPEEGSCCWYPFLSEGTVNSFCQELEKCCLNKQLTTKLLTMTTRARVRAKDGNYEDLKTEFMDATDMLEPYWELWKPANVHHLVPITLTMLHPHSKGKPKTLFVNVKVDEDAAGLGAQLMESVDLLHGAHWSSDIDLFGNTNPTGHQTITLAECSATDCSFCTKKECIFGLLENLSTVAQQELLEGEACQHGQKGAKKANKKRRKQGRK